MKSQPVIDTQPKVSDEVRQTTCYMCACRCGINVHLKDGDIINARNRDRSRIAWSGRSIDVPAHRRELVATRNGICCGEAAYSSTVTDCSCTDVYFTVGGVMVWDFLVNRVDSDRPFRWNFN